MNIGAEREFKFVAAQLSTDELVELDKLVQDGDIDGGNYIKGDCGCFYGSIALIRRELDEDHWLDVPDFRDKLLGDNAVMFHADEYFTELENAVMRITIGSIPEYNVESLSLHLLLQAEITRRQFGGATSIQIKAVSEGGIVFKHSVLYLAGKTVEVVDR